MADDSYAKCAVNNTKITKLQSTSCFNQESCKVQVITVYLVLYVRQDHVPDESEAADVHDSEARRNEVEVDELRERPHAQVELRTNINGEC